MSRVHNLVAGSTISTDVPVRDPANISNQFNFDLTGISGSLLFGVPTNSTTLVGTDSVQTLTNKTIIGAGITGGTIQGAALSNVTISSSGMSGGTIQGSAITGGSMQGSVLSNVYISASGMSGGTIQGSAITGGTMVGTGITGGTIQGSAITGGTLQGSVLNNVSIFSSGMSGGTIQGSAITGGTIIGAGVTGGTMQGTALSDVTISSSGMSGGTIQGSAITGGTMQGSALSNVTIANSGMSGGTIQGTAISYCTIANSNFTGVTSIAGAPNTNLTITPASGYNLVVDGNLEITGTGTRTNINTVDLNVRDNYVYLNNGYTSGTALPSGVVVNLQSTGVSTNIDTGAFSSTSVVNVVDTTGMAVGDLIQVANPNNPANEGVYEILSLTSTTITIDSSPVAAFAQTAFIADATVAGTVNVTTVSVIRAGTDGIWETGVGSTNALAYQDLLTTGSGEVVITATGSTTNATPGSINILSGITANTSYFVQVDVQGVSSTFSDVVGFRLLGNGMSDGVPVISQVGPLNDSVKFAPLANTWTADLSFSGTSINVVPTAVGFVGTVNWKVRAIIRAF